MCLVSLMSPAAIRDFLYGDPWWGWSYTRGLLPGRWFAVISTPFKGNLLPSDDMGMEAAATCDCHSHVWCSWWSLWVRQRVWQVDCGVLDRKLTLTWGCHRKCTSGFGSKFSYFRCCPQHKTSGQTRQDTHSQREKRIVKKWIIGLIIKM